MTWEMLKNDVAYAARKEGLEEGRAAGRVEGRAEGKAEGKAEGGAEKEEEFEKALGILGSGERNPEVYRQAGISESVIRIVLK